IHTRSIFLSIILQHPRSTLFPYTTLFRSEAAQASLLIPQGGDDDISPKPRPALAHLPRFFFEMAFEEEARQVRKGGARFWANVRSEEHTSELQSRRDLVCRLLLEKKKKN